MLRKWSEVQKTDVDCRPGVCIFLTGAELIEVAAEIGKRTFGPVEFIVDLHFQIDEGLP
jgi:hypothetical protein